MPAKAKKEAYNPIRWCTVRMSQSAVDHDEFKTFVDGAAARCGTPRHLPDQAFARFRGCDDALATDDSTQRRRLVELQNPN